MVNTREAVLLIQALFWLILTILAVWILRRVVKARRRARRHREWHRTEAKAVQPTRPNGEIPDRREPRLTRWPREIKAQSDRKAG